MARPRSNEKRLKIPPPLEIAWFAGLVDGEGSIQIQPAKPSKTARNKRTVYRLSLSVGMTHYPTLVFIRDMWGIGALCPAPLKAPHGRKPYWIWSAKSNDALKILELCYPYQKTKRAEAEIAIYFQKARNARSIFWGGYIRNIPDSELDKDKDLMLKLKESRTVSDLLK